MKYTKFKIKNYKGISECEIDLSNNRILTLVGLNESGKTTILESIHFFHRLIVGQKPNQRKLNEIRPKGISFTGKVEIRAQLELDDEDISEIEKFHKGLGKRTGLTIPDTFEYAFKFDFVTHEYKKTRKACNFAIKTTNAKSILNKTNKPHWEELVGFVKKKLIPEILFYEDFIFEIPEQIVFETIEENKGVSEVVEQKNKRWQLVLDDILKTVDSRFTSFQEFIVDLWASDNDTATNRISSMEGLLNEKITQGWKELFKEKSSGRKKVGSKLNFKEIRLISNISGSQIHFSFKVKNDSGKEFQIKERSKGFRWFFSFLIFTEFRKGRTKNILFLLDEPASNLHSSAQQKILDAIEQLGDGSMVIYSTHSHHLINPVWLNGAYVVINDSISEDQLMGGFTENIGALKITAKKYYNYVSGSRKSVKTLLFQPILDRLDYAPSQIEPAPDLVITEGKYDWYTFKYFYEVIGSFPKKINLYPGLGATQHWDIIRLYLSWGSHFILILDSDPPGKRAKTAYIKEFGSFVEDNIFTYKDVFGKSMVTEDLISAGDRKILCDSAFGSGTYNKIRSDPKTLKSKLNYAINQLLVTKTKVKLGNRTLDDFKKLHKFMVLKMK